MVVISYNLIFYLMYLSLFSKFLIEVNYTYNLGKAIITSKFYLSYKMHSSDTIGQLRNDVNIIYTQLCPSKGEEQQEHKYSHQ